MTEVIKVEDCGENIGDYDVPIYKAILIPKNAKNGDVIKAMFPNISIYEHGSTYSVNNEYNFNSTWWNAPYRVESEESDERG